jgi:hypothetical protein
MAESPFQEALSPLYPELGTNPPDPDAYADSVIVRVLNTGPDTLREQMLAYYGTAKVQAVAQARVNRLDAPIYRQWKARLHLPERAAAVEKIHSLWRR